MNEQVTRFVAEVRKGRSTDAAAKAVGATREEAEVWLTNDVVKASIAAPEPVKPEKPKRAPRKRTARKK